MPMRFIYFTTLNVISLCRSVLATVVLNCRSKWVENESNFCPFLSRHRISKKRPYMIYFESLQIVTYINIVTHGEFYFVDNTFRPEFTIVDTFYVEF